ncbi:MAG: UbiX family flavin prenyltransferase [bacterium]
MSTGRLVVGMTGASGSIYGLRFLKYASEHYNEVYVITSEEALQVISYETECSVNRHNLSSKTLLGDDLPQLKFLSPSDYFSPPASGSFNHDGMVIIPCTAGTAGRIANGVSDDLMIRSADVCLKEGRKLILVVRETPLSLIHLRNLTQLAEAGATIIPASPSFYNKPKTIEALADTVIARVLQNLGVNQSIIPEWQAKN